jgi:hypothetical protein
MTEEEHEYTVQVLDNSARYWHLNGKRHREDGPAVECTDGTREWYLNGDLHREDGPACEYPDGTRWWYLNGKRHREDGPAIEYSDGRRWWYLNGEEYTEEEFIKKAAKVKELTVAEIEALLGYQIKVVK